jgi:prephenate dehydrogenase/chorismate mutase/prephenate dehydrogenase
MGRFFHQQLLAAGHQVQVLERNDWAEAEQLLGTAELVLICVPIAEVLTTVRQAVPYLNPSAVLADITSIKEPIVQEMLAHHPGPVLGLHPMFGPGVPSFLSQTVIVCPGRQTEACQWLLDLIEAQGGNLTVCTPAEHDRMMVFIQAVRHFLTFSLGVFLAEENLDLAHSLDFASPPYRLQLNLVSRLFAQDTPLYLETMIASEERRQVIGRLAATYHRLAQQVSQQDPMALRQVFLKARSAFQADTGRALAESNHLITSLSLFLAAQRAEAPSAIEPPAPESRIAVIH